MNKIRCIAIYLPQFHPIPENNEWWGKGFTEWTNVAKAKPFYPGHYQPKIPADLGFYDLRLADVREEQANLAKSAGIDGFCYWHYWFGNGKELLERPFDEVLKTGKPDFPFCLGWANHSWYKKTWDKKGNNKLLIEQKYLGEDDYVAHFNKCLPAFLDKRYILHNNCPVFVIWEPLQSPEIEKFIHLWNKLAKENGFDGMYFIGFSYRYNLIEKMINLGVEKVLYDPLFEIQITNKLIVYLKKIPRFLLRLPRLVSYNRYAKAAVNRFKDKNIIPCVLPNYDHTPRSGFRGTVLLSSPEKYKHFFKKVFQLAKEKDDDFIFIKSWNEWGEGNYLEPDLKYGDEYLQKTKEVICDFKGKN